MENVDLVNSSWDAHEKLSFPISRSHIRVERMMLWLLSLVFVPAIWAALYFSVKLGLATLGIEASDEVVLLCGAVALVAYVVVALKRPNNFHSIELADDSLILRRRQKEKHVQYRDVYLFVAGGGRRAIAQQPSDLPVIIKSKQGKYLAYMDKNVREQFISCLQKRCEWAAFVDDNDEYQWPVAEEAKAQARGILQNHYRRIVGINIVLAILLSLPAAWCIYIWEFGANIIWAIIFSVAALAAVVGVIYNRIKLGTLDSESPSDPAPSAGKKQYTFCYEARNRGTLTGIVFIFALCVAFGLAVFASPWFGIGVVVMAFAFYFNVRAYALNEKTFQEIDEGILRWGVIGKEQRVDELELSGVSRILIDAHEPDAIAWCHGSDEEVAIDFIGNCDALCAALKTHYPHIEVEFAKNIIGKRRRHPEGDTP